jgi:hypothetical protein
MVTFFFSTIGLENASNEDMELLLTSENLIQFRPGQCDMVQVLEPAVHEPYIPAPPIIPTYVQRCGQTGPAARPTDSLYEFRAHPLDVLFSGFRFLNRDHPADPFVARKRGNVLSCRERSGISALVFCRFFFGDDFGSRDRR